jgi:hypothetical protein
LYSVRFSAAGHHWPLVSTQHSTTLQTSYAIGSQPITRQPRSMHALRSQEPTCGKSMAALANRGDKRKN